MLDTIYPGMVNSPQTTLSSSIDNSQTTIPVSNAALLPDAPNLATLGLDENAETILYTGKSGNDLTGCSRGFQGTAQSWNSGTRIARNFTEYDWRSMYGNFNKQKEDYEYQTPVVVGTQVQIEKQSNTNRLPFYLSSALSGGAITISLDSGSTSTPLQDVDGNAVIELPKGYIEVVDNSTFFVYAPKGGAFMKSRQSGLIALSSATSITVTVNAIDTSKSILRLSFQGTSSARYTVTKGVITNSTTLTFSKNDATGTANISWELIEYNCKQVQSGSLSFTQFTEQTVTVSSIDVNKSQLFASYSTNNASDSGFCLRSRIISATSIGFYMDISSSTASIQWYLVEFN